MCYRNVIDRVVTEIAKLVAWSIRRLEVHRFSVKAEVVSANEVYALKGYHYA